MTLLLSLSGSMAVALLTFAMTCRLWQCEAIEHGVAKWKIDPLTGKKSFVWLTKKEPPHDA